MLGCHQCSMCPSQITWIPDHALDSSIWEMFGNIDHASRQLTLNSLLPYVSYNVHISFMTKYCALFLRWAYISDAIHSFNNHLFCIFTTCITPYWAKNKKIIELWLRHQIIHKVHKIVVRQRSKETCGHIMLTTV